MEPLVPQEQVVHRESLGKKVTVVTTQLPRV